MNPAHRVMRTTGAVLAALACIVSGLSTPAQARPSGTESTQAQLTLLQQSGPVAADGDFVAYFEVSGTPAGSDLAVDIYPAVTTMAQLDAAEEGKPRSSIGTFPVVELPGDPESAPVQTGFVINLSGRGQPTRPGGWAKRLTKPGVYPVRIRLRGPDNTTVATVVTYLLRSPAPGERVDRSAVALMPVVSADGSPAERVEAPDAPLDGETLAGLDALAKVFTEHPTTPATFSVAPDLARRLAQGSPAAGAPPVADTTTSTASTSSTSTMSGDPDDPAATTLAALRALLKPANRQVLAAPTDSADPTELVTLGLSEELRIQAETGTRLLTEILEPPVTDTWSIPERLTTPTVDALARLGVTDLLVPEGALSGPAAAPAPVPGADDRARVVSVPDRPSTGGHADPVLAANHLVGRLAALAAIAGAAADDAGSEDPDESTEPTVPLTAQVVTVALPATPTDRAELTALLDLTVSNPFLSPTTVSDLFDRTSVEPVALTQPAPFTQTRWALDLREVRGMSASYASMVPDRPELAATIAEPLSRSTTAGLPAEVRKSQVAEVRSELVHRFTQITVPESDQVTLGARDARFPLVLTSAATEPVRVSVELTASDRLTIVEPRREVVLDREHNVISVQVRSRVPGDTPLHVRVLTPDGLVLLDEGRYSVRSTAISGVGLVLTLGAGMFLALWWGRHIWRSRHKRGRHAR